jgi:hypothetical protein
VLRQKVRLEKGDWLQSGEIPPLAEGRAAGKVCLGFYDARRSQTEPHRYGGRRRRLKA